MQLLLFPPRMASLAHIHTYDDNKAAQGWANRGSVRTASAVGPILCCRVVIVGVDMR